MSNYITEAFKQLNLLEDAEDITLDASGINELRSFLDDAAVDPDEEMPMDIFDLEAEAKEDLKKSYEGKVILECSVCHSNVFEDPINVSMNEEGLACQDIECPYCMSNEGYYIIGEVAPYSEEGAEEFSDEDELDEVDIEGAADDIDDEDIIEESMKLDGVKELYKKDEIRGVKELKGSDKMKGSDEIRGDKYSETLDESLWDSLQPLLKSTKSAASKLNKKRKSKKNLKEDIDTEIARCMKNGIDATTLEPSDFEDIVIDGKHLRSAVTLSLEKGAKVKNLDRATPEVKRLLKKYTKNLKESIEDVTINTEDETMTMSTKEDGGVIVETSPKMEDSFGIDDIEIFDDETEDTGEEMIAPISDETAEAIDASVDALDDTDEEEFDTLKDELGDENELGEIEEFDEESFDNLGESYLRNCYENVNYFKTSNVSSKGNKLFIEGIIGFDSGNQKKTNFVFEAVKNDKNKYKFEGYNKEISRGKKTFKLSGTLKNKKLMCETLNYNYRSRNELNESVRVYGTIRKKK